MKKVVSIVGTVLAVLVLVSMVIQPAPPASASQPAAPTVAEDTSGLLISAPEWTRSTREWTDAEMAAAQPYPLRELTDRSAVGVSPDLAAPDGEPGLVPMVYPEGVKALSGLPGLDVSQFAAPTGYSYPGPFTRYIDYSSYKKTFPQRAIGKVFFYQRGYAYVCSGVSIGNAAVWTAGHCVHDGLNSSAGWSYNMIFVPAYQYGKHPAGIWLGVQMTVFTTWYQSANLGRDNGGVIVARVKRRVLQQKAGAIGFAWNWGYEQHWFEIGYPQASPFDGQSQVVCASSFAYADTAFTPNTIGVGCDQTGGTSGGPWIFRYWPYYGGYLNGNMSYRYSGYSNEIFSPYFDSTTYGLYSALIAVTP